jgi:hypothetical protein
MENFKLASFQKLRFNSSRGVLATEQLWDLPITELDTLTVALEAELEASGKKSYLVKATEKSKAAKLRFDIALDILNTRVEMAQAATEAAENKAHNQKILSLIAEKQDESLKGKSVEELEKLLK